MNVAPMGPKIGRQPGRFLLRPYRTSTTYRNLKDCGEGVLHVTDDVLLIAQAAIGILPVPASRPAERINGRVLLTTGRYLEFRVIELDDRTERTTIEIEAVAQGVLTDLFGLNRAKHAVIEAAILATRLDFLPIDEILDDFKRLAIPVDKTGGADERLAFGVLLDRIQDHARSVQLSARSSEDPILHCFPGEALP